MIDYALQSLAALNQLLKDFWLLLLFFTIPSWYLVLQPMLMWRQMRRNCAMGFIAERTEVLAGKSNRLSTIANAIPVFFYRDARIMQAWDHIAAKCRQPDENFSRDVANLYVEIAELMIRYIVPWYQRLWSETVLRRPIYPRHRSSMIMGIGVVEVKEEQAKE